MIPHRMQRATETPRGSIEGATSDGIEILRRVAQQVAVA
jgi:hypothetical protein